MFLMPSQFEPCGLNQMYSLRYGTVPIVHAVGGLDDTIQPYTARAQHANGFKFREAIADALVRTVRQAVRLYHDKAVWLPLMRRAWRRTTRGRRPPGNMSKCTDGLDATRPRVRRG